MFFFRSIDSLVADIKSRIDHLEAVADRFHRRAMKHDEKAASLQAKSV